MISLGGLDPWVSNARAYVCLFVCYFVLQGVLVYVDDIIIILLSILNLVEKYHTFPKFHLLKPNYAGSLFHGILVEPAKATGSMRSPLSVCPYVRNELISETAPTIFLKLGMKLGDNKGKKIARPDF